MITIRLCFFYPRRDLLHQRKLVIMGNMNKTMVMNRMNIKKKSKICLATYACIKNEGLLQAMNLTAWTNWFLNKSTILLKHFAKLVESNLGLSFVLISAISFFIYFCIIKRRFHRKAARKIVFNNVVLKLCLGSSGRSYWKVLLCQSDIL